MGSIHSDLFPGNIDANIRRPKNRSRTLSVVILFLASILLKNNSFMIQITVELKK